MGIGDRLLAKTSNVEARKPGADTPPPSGEARTSPGRLMDVQGRINAAQSRIRELETQLAERASFDVKLDALVEVPGRRRKLTPEQYAELKANLERHVLATPILVRPLGDDRFELIAGHNRTSIYRELGRTTIRANSVAVDEREVELAALFSNLLAPALSDFEKYWHFRRLQDVTGLSRAEIAESAGLSKSHVSRIFAFDALPEDAKTVLAERPERLGSNAAEKLAALAQKGDPGKVVDAVRRLVEDSAFTQEQAVALATVRPPRPVAAEPVVIRAGKKKVCEVSARNGVVGVRFYGSDGDAAGDWAARIADFIREEMAGAPTEPQSQE
jgi:ParB family transcriptional regulator, chromosome partitioning protein